jgi:hypothetical protein
VSVWLSYEAPCEQLRSLSSKGPKIVTLPALENHLKEYLEGQDVYHHVMRRGDRIHISLHPAEERMTFWIREGKIGGTARTSGAGPGYHTFVVGLLDDLAKACQFQWVVSDPSGYWEHRQRGPLEEAMGQFLRRVVGDIAAEGDGLWTLNFPAHRTVIDAPYPVLTPTGPWDETHIQTIRDATQPEQLARFFPWWRERDAGYWAGIGQSLRWMEVIWTPYDPPGQRETRLACRDAFYRARRLNPEASLPLTELAKIDQLLGKNVTRPMSLNERAKACAFQRMEDGFVGGYRFHRHRWTVAGRWEIELPGDFTQPQPAENGTWSSVGPDTELFLTPYGSVDPDPARSVVAATSIQRQLLATARRKGRVMDVIQMPNSAQPEAVVWESHTGEVLLQGAKSAAGTFILVTFMANSTAATASWVPLWNSLESVID